MLIIALAAMLAISTALPAFAAIYGVWRLSPGDTTISGAVKKSSYGSASISPSVQSGGPKIWYRCRDGENSSEKASVVKGYTSKPSSISLSYLSGYGVVGNNYRLAAQNDSASSTYANVAGTWTP